MSGLVDRCYDVAEDPKLPPKWAQYLVLAYADDGEFYLPCLYRRKRRHGHTEPWWDRRLRPRRPTHWPYMVMTALTRWVVWVESC